MHKRTADESFHHSADEPAPPPPDSQRLNLGKVAVVQPRGSCGWWKTHLPVLACEESVHAARASRQKSDEWGGGNRNSDQGKNDGEEIVGGGQRLVGGMRSVSMQTDSPTCLTANHFLSAALMGGGGGDEQQRWKPSLDFFLCRSLHLHCCVLVSLSVSLPWICSRFSRSRRHGHQMMLSQQEVRNRCGSDPGSARLHLCPFCSILLSPLSLHRLRNHFIIKLCCFNKRLEVSEALKNT